MSRIEKSVGSPVSKDVLKIVWDDRALKYKGQVVWTQHKNDNDGDWSGQFSQFSDDMNDE